MHPADPVEAKIKRAADVAEIERSAAIVQHSSADYYALIARTLAHLKENTYESRRSIYAHAETQLMRELRALDPPLPEAEITSERLSLHEAIRRVEAEAVRSRLEFLVEKQRDPNCGKNAEAHARLQLPKTTRPLRMTSNRRQAGVLLYLQSVVLRS